jgi:hypothetical protein
LDLAKRVRLCLLPLIGSSRTERPQFDLNGRTCTAIGVRLMATSLPEGPSVGPGRNEATASRFTFIHQSIVQLLRTTAIWFV